MSDSQDILLLDTHVWVWLMTGADQLKNSPCIFQIDQAILYSGLRVSAVSVWEVGKLEYKGRLKFHMDCLTWVKKSITCSRHFAIRNNAGDCD